MTCSTMIQIQFENNKIEVSNKKLISFSYFIPITHSVLSGWDLFTQNVRKWLTRSKQLETGISIIKVRGTFPAWRQDSESRKKQSWWNLNNSGTNIIQ